MIKQQFYVKFDRCSIRTHNMSIDQLFIVENRHGANVPWFL